MLGSTLSMTEGGDIRATRNALLYHNVRTMLSAEQNERLTRVDAGTPMGELLRRYWHPIAASAQLREKPVRPIRLLGESLTLYRDRQGRLGLVGERCAHRLVALEFGYPVEEGLRCPSLGAVLGEVSELAPAAARRLQLAAEAGGVAALAVTSARLMAGGATTRWRVAAAPSVTPPWGGIGPPAWTVTLERCRGGLPRTWTLEWRAGEFVEMAISQQDAA